MGLLSFRKYCASKGAGMTSPFDIHRSQEFAPCLL
jgi:hypothetical protein